MTPNEINLARRALELLHRLLQDEPQVVDSTPRRCPVAQFARRYLVRDPSGEVTCTGLWQFYHEVAAAGEVEPLSKSEFLRRLPGVMEATFGVKKCHNIRRGTQTVRGFKSVTIAETP